MRIVRAALPLVLFAAFLPAFAQEHRGVNDNAFYEVKFTLTDSAAPAGKNVRSYLLIVAANRKATLKVGDRVPLATASFQAPVQGGAPVMSTQYSYADVGATLECLVADVGSKYAMHGIVSLSAVDPEKPKTPNPTLGETHLEWDTAVDPGRPTLIAAIDDPANSRKLQVEATVTKLP